MKINQYNGKICDELREIIAGKVAQLVGKEGKSTGELLNWLLWDIAIDVLAK